MLDRIGQLRRIEELLGIGLPYLIETWQDPLGIDPTVWTQVLTAGGTITDPPSLAEEPYHKVILAGAATGDAARLRTVHQWQLAPDTWGTNTFNKLLIAEWEAKFDGVVDIDQATFFMGLSAIALATRASTNIAGFILDGAGALNSITDDAIGETAKAVGAPVLTNYHKYTILAYNAIIEFYVDEVMQARHTTTDGEDLPDVNAHGQFYIAQNGGGGGSGELHVATTNIRPGAIL